MIFFPSLQYILTVHERHCGFSRWPDATTECYLHCLRSWPQGSSASWHCAQLSLCFPPSNPWVVQYWESWVLMVVVVWRLSAFETRETDEQKKKNQIPKLQAQFVRYWDFQAKVNFCCLWHWLWIGVGEGLCWQGPAQKHGGNTVCSVTREYCWQRHKADIRLLVIWRKERLKGLSRMIIRANSMKYLR